MGGIAAECVKIWIRKKNLDIAEGHSSFWISYSLWLIWHAFLHHQLQMLCLTVETELLDLTLVGKIEQEKANTISMRGCSENVYSPQRPPQHSILPSWRLFFCSTAESLRRFHAEIGQRFLYHTICKCLIQAFYVRVKETRPAAA